jgi:glycosyltransferase involved in cell wall biosynthesis
MVYARVMAHTRSSGQPPTVTMRSDSIDVCVITTIHADYDARIYDRSVRVLAEAGLRVGFIGPWPHTEASGVAAADWFQTKRPAKRSARPLAALRAFLMARRTGAKVFHFHDIDFLPWAILLSAVTAAKVVYDVHENYPEDMIYRRHYVPGYLRPMLSWVVDRLERYAVHRFAATVVVVPSLADRLGPLARRLVLVRNFSRLDPMPDLPHAPALLYSGGIMRSYGSSTLLAIGRELQRRGTPARLVVVDRFLEPDLRPGFLEAIATEALPIDVMPPVHPSELWRVLTLGSIGLVPDVHSPIAHLGLHAKFFDYMAMGLPIVASDIENARALIESAQCGVLVPSEDATAFVEAALALLGDDSRLHRLRQNGMEAIRRSYSWRVETAKLVALMRDLVQESGGSSVLEPATHRNAVTLAADRSATR